MLFSKPPQSVGPLLFKGNDEEEDEAQELLRNLQKRGTGDTTSNFLLIFSVADIVQFKQDAHKLIRRLNTLCVLLTSLIAAAVGLWLLDVLMQ